AKSASPSPADEKIRLLRAVRYHHLAVARELFVAEGRKQFPRHRQMVVTNRPQEPDFFISR
ncbi:hypothetical protein, partial [Aeromonas caviae]|uniref:hypothetical protein n=1 Tax=Aeromonas caviae TaxID=648 RepID=UPI001CC7275D